MNRIIYLAAICIFLTTTRVKSQELTPAQLVQKQLDGYNNRDLEDFLAPYSDSVKVYNHPNQMIIDSKLEMKIMYEGLFAKNTDLHCTLINRMVLNNVVIDQEYVIFAKDQPAAEVIAMYKIYGGKIAEVYFIRPD